MDILESYLHEVTRIMNRIVNDQAEQISRAAEAIVDAHTNGRKVFIFGPGVHSFMAVEEVTYRAGGVPWIRPICEHALTLSSGAIHATRFERTVGLAASILDIWEVESGDVLLLNNAYGINCVALDTAMECQRRNITCIGLTSSIHSLSIPAGHPSRHPSNSNLFELCSMYVDTYVPVGDAVVQLDNLPVSIGPSSTFAMAMAVNSIICKVVEIMVYKGYDPEVLRSGNSPGGNEYIKPILAKYKKDIRHMW